jgi:hypothetical protein
MTATNSLNISSNGLVAYNNATGVFSETAMVQYSILSGGANAQSIVQTAPSATAGVPLVSNGAAAQPHYSTAVVAGGGTGLSTLTAYELIAAGTTSTGNVQQIALGTSGQVLTSNGPGALASYQTPSSGISWVDVTSGTQTIAASTGYVTDNATQVTYTLPATATLGSVFEITGGVSGSATAPWTIAQNANQQINFGSSSTTVGTGGSLTSTLQYDSVRLVAVVSGSSTVWNVLSSVGNLTVV